VADAVLSRKAIKGTAPKARANRQAAIGPFADAIASRIADRSR